VERLQGRPVGARPLAFGFEPVFGQVKPAVLP
jgi:hypothetical protein